MRALLAVALVAVMAFSGCFRTLGGGNGLLDVTAGDLVSSKTYKAWHIEVDYSKSAKPDNALINFVMGRLKEVVDKPDGVGFTLDTDLGASSKRWSTDDIIALADANMGSHSDGTRVETYLVFLDGSFAGDTSDGKVLGLGIGHGIIAIFSDTIKATCTLQNLCVSQSSTNQIFQAVVVHEFGHLIGLVNNGIADTRGHEDSSHPHHSKNNGSVMYWAVETNGITSLIPGGIPTTFDADDKADLKAAGGR